MPLHLVDVCVMKNYRALVSSRRLRKVAEAVLDWESPESPLVMDLSVVDDETVKQLNRDYRGLDETTDVLSFSFLSQGRYYGEGARPTSSDRSVSFVTPPGYGNCIGEVIISFDQASRQAQENRQATEGEIDFLVVHGVLHLLGYDHAEPEEEAIMQEKTRRIVASLPSQ